MCLGHWRRARSITPVGLGLAGVALALAAAHLASRSRAGVLSLAAGLLVLGMLAGTALFHLDSRFGGRRLPLLGTGLLAALVVLGFAWLSVAASAREHLFTLLAGSSDASGSYRTAMRLAAAHPLLGSGVGAYEDAIPRYKTNHGEVRTTHAESDVLEFVAEGGLLGLAAVGWLSLFLLRRFRDRLSNGRDPFRKGIAIGAISGAAALGVHSLFDFNLRIPSNALVFVTLLGLAASPPRNVDAGLRPVRGGWSRALAAALAALALVSFWRARGAHNFDRAMAHADLNSRIEALDRLLPLHPYIAEAWRARGVAWRDLAAAASPMRLLRLTRSDSDLTRALRLRPRWAEAWADRAWVRGMRGDLKAAAEDLDRALELDPTHAGIQLLHSHLRR
jgi:tetratricopeptide (TPR) repeat protein